MKNFLYSIKNGISEVLFPAICVICGLKLSDAEHFVCQRCLNDKFEGANPDGLQASSDTLLPEGIILQHALWKFDKGGYLQELLHKLKYSYLTGVGVDLGRQLGKSLMGNPWFPDVLADGAKGQLLLVPVPLHKRKNRKRGYNQSYYIAKGVSEVTGLPLIGTSVVQRTKHTRTQTGFSTEQRKENMKGAFLVADATAVYDKSCVLIDDVFTTGATTFELALSLKKEGAREILIATVAQA